MDALPVAPSPPAAPPRLPDPRAGQPTAVPASSEPAITPAPAAGTRENAPRRNVLVVASRFPPVASVGATRVRKFVKYLREFGWNPIVITGATRHGTVTAGDPRRAADYESLRDLPEDLPIQRLSAVLDHWPSHLARASATRLARFKLLTGLDEHAWSSLLRWRLQGLHDRLAFPDRGIWRLPAVVKLAIRLHRQHHFDAVFSSGMPFSDHMAGLAIHYVLRRPWLADFRDPWVEYIHWQQWRSDWGHRLTRWAEAAVIRKATWVISVNDHMTDRFVARYGRCAAGKCVTIANGFDPADFPSEVEERPNVRFRLLYAGSLYKTRSPINVLESFRRFIQGVPGSREHAKFDFAGRPGPYVGEFNQRASDGTLEHIGMLSHASALREMARADVNVVMLPNLPGGENDTTTKLYECLGSGRAVLAVVPADGAAAKVLRGHDGVWMCNPDDVDGIARAITDMYRLWLSGNLRPKRSADKLRPHTRRCHAERLAACLDAAVSSRRQTKGARG
ncbi:MAG TPA: glycosyltransferase [Phycisphaerae bacterium]|nr:glycosyltransferase [Phycisphaerae bacterium]